MREIEMLKFEIEKMREFSVDELREKLVVEYSDFVESGVYKIEFDSNELLSVSKVEVIDGCFEVIDEERDYIEMRNGFVNCVVTDEYGYDFYRVEVELDEEDVFENGELIIEDVSSDVDVDSGVLVYSYKGKYVVMNFDYGGSLCECDVYESLDEIKC